MVFKLLRIDASVVRKIPLDVGKHLVGRGSGKFLQCDDKRVSRQHGELEVTDNSITLRALHTNPCFYLRKGTIDREILKQHESVVLGNGDKFGLLPADCWYEILYLPDSDKDNDKQETTVISESNRTALDNTEMNTDNIVASLPSKNANERPQNDDIPSSPNVSDQSQSLLQNAELPSPTQRDPPPAAQNDAPHTSTQTDSRDLQPSPGKRPLPGTSEVKTEPSDDIKRIKTELDISIPGTSYAQNGVHRDMKQKVQLQSTDSSMTCFTEEIISKINSHLTSIIPSDSWDQMAKSWAVVLRNLPKSQQIFAPKLINDVLYQAQLNTLSRHSRLDVRLPSSTIDLTDF